MTKQQETFLSSRSENILDNNWKTKSIEGSLPGIMYQPKEIILGDNMNDASASMDASFRKLLADVIPYPKSMKMQTAIKSALLQWLKFEAIPSEPPGNTIPFISQLSFNEASSLKCCLHVPLTVTMPNSNELLLQIPAMIPTSAFTAPQNTSSIHFKVAAASCDISTGEAIESCSGYVTVPYHSGNIPGNSISLPLRMPDNSLTIVVAALDYFIIENGIDFLIDNERFRPSQVIGGVVK